jgi:membrane-associated progesterone receptor component
MPKAHPPTVLFTTYTPRTLAPFSGRDGGRILLAINGKVFDVTAGRNFYGPGV